MDTSHFSQQESNCKMADANRNVILSSPPYSRDPAKWDEEHRGHISNRDVRIGMEKGYVYPMRRYEFDSVKIRDTATLDYIAKHTEQMCNNVDVIRKNQVFPSLLQDGYWDEYEEEYKEKLGGKDDNSKCFLVATSLYQCCLEDGQPSIDNPSFLLWLYERKLVPVVGVCGRFLNLARTTVHELSTNDAKRVIQMTFRVCGWNAALSHEARFIALSQGRRFDLCTAKRRREEEEDERSEENDEKEEEKGEEIDSDEDLDIPFTHVDFDRVVRDCEFVHLLDNARIHREMDVDGMMERMGEIDRPENQLHLLLEWAMQHRSAMGCTLTARIVKRWNLPSSRDDLLLFLLSTRPSEEKTKDEKRFMRTVARLFLALSYENLITYDDVTRFYENNKANLDDGDSSSSLTELISNLPDIHSKRVIPLARPRTTRYRKAPLMERIWYHLVDFLNCLFCTSSQSWYAPMDSEGKEEMKEILDGARSLSYRDSHELAMRAGDAVMGVWREGVKKVEEKRISRLSLPSRSSLLVLCQIFEATVDSSLLPRFLMQCLPYLQSISLISPYLSIHSSTVALFLTARCFQSHLTVVAMEIWSKLRQKMCALLQSLCPLHWQTARLAKLFNVWMPSSTCRLKHGTLIGRFESLPQIVERVKTITITLIRGDNWTEQKLIRVADALANLFTGVGGERAREWWKNIIMAEIELGGPRQSSMTRLLSLSVYRGMIDTGEIVREMMGRMRSGDESIVNVSLTVLNALLNGEGASREEEELLVEGSMERGEEIGEIVEILGELSEYSSPSIRERAATMLNKLIKRQYTKRIVRGRMEGREGGEKRREGGRNMKMSLQLLRKVSSPSWIGLDVTGDEMMPSLSVFDIDTAVCEMKMTLEEQECAADAAGAASKIYDQLVSTIYTSMEGSLQRASLVHVFLTRLRRSMIESSEPLSLSAYRNLATALIARFVCNLKKEEWKSKSLPLSSFLLPTILFACQDVKEETKDQLYKSIQQSLRQWRGVECSSVLLLVRLSVILSNGREEKRDWTPPILEIIKKGIIGEERNGSLYESLISSMIKMEGRRRKKMRMKDEEDEMDKGDIEEEDESGFMSMLDGWSTSQILKFLRPVPRFEKTPKFEFVKRKEGKMVGLKLVQEFLLKSDQWMERKEDSWKKWKTIYKADPIAGGLSFTAEQRKRKLSQENLRRVDFK